MYFLSLKIYFVKSTFCFIHFPAKPEEISSNEVISDDDENEQHCEECGQFLNNVSFHSFNGGITEKEALEFFENVSNLKVSNASVFDSVGHLVSFKRVSSYSYSIFREIQ